MCSNSDERWFMWRRITCFPNRSTLLSWQRTMTLLWLFTRVPDVTDTFVLFVFYLPYRFLHYARCDGHLCSVRILSTISFPNERWPIYSLHFARRGGHVSFVRILSTLSLPILRPLWRTPFFCSYFIVVPLVVEFYTFVQYIVSFLDCHRFSVVALFFMFIGKSFGFVRLKPQQKIVPTQQKLFIF